MHAACRPASSHGCIRATSLQDTCFQSAAAVGMATRGAHPPGQGVALKAIGGEEAGVLPKVGGKEDGVGENEADEEQQQLDQGQHEVPGQQPPGARALQHAGLPALHCHGQLVSVNVVSPLNPVQCKFGTRPCIQCCMHYQQSSVACWETAADLHGAGAPEQPGVQQR